MLTDQQLAALRSVEAAHGTLPTALADLIHTAQLSGGLAGAGLPELPIAQADSTGALTTGLPNANTPENAVNQLTAAARPRLQSLQAVLVGLETAPLPGRGHQQQMQIR
eukprot:3027789-Amphidinium_carterae.1